MTGAVFDGEVQREPDARVPTLEGIGVAACELARSATDVGKEALDEWQAVLSKRGLI
jgi:hypothetical protein